MAGSAKCSKLKKTAAFLCCLIALTVLVMTLSLSPDKAEPTALQLLEAKIPSIEDPSVRQAYQGVYDAFSQTLPGIICWGDSLTVGAGGNGMKYPDVLETQIGDRLTHPYDAYLAETSLDLPEIPYVPVVNMGVAGEDSTTILARSGAIPMITAAPLRIPIMKDYTPISLISSNGKKVDPLLQGRDGLEHVYLNGVKGYLNIRPDPADESGQDYIYCFSRSRRGLPREIPEGTPVVTAGSQAYLNYIPVIFMGTNLGFDTAEELIQQHKALIAHHDQAPRDNNGSPCFIIVGVMPYNLEDPRPIEQAMEKEFGRNYINLREYMSTDALRDAGITPTAEDLDRMSKGLPPTSLMVEDLIHYNAAGYELIGKLIYGRMEELHYFDAADSAMAQLYHVLSAAENGGNSN